MASRRVPDGLLATRVGVAGAGALLLALVTSVTLFASGCGGGDSSSATEATGGTAAAESRAGTGNPRTAEGADARGGGAGAGASGQGPSAPGKSGKHGPGVAEPKGKREPGITPKQRSKATTVDMALASPAFSAGTTLPIRYSCDGKDASPQLRWSGIPADTGELVLFVLNLLPVERRLFFDWAVAGLKPGLTSIPKGELPPGAVPGRNSFGKRGYSICPPAGKPEKYLFMLYAIPRPLKPKPGFDPLALREAVLAESGDLGLFATSYDRR